MLVSQIQQWYPSMSVLIVAKRALILRTEYFIETIDPKLAKQVKQWGTESSYLPCLVLKLEVQSSTPSYD